MFGLKFIRKDSLATIRTIICFIVAFILVLSPVAQPFVAFAEDLPPEDPGTEAPGDDPSGEPVELPTVQFNTDNSTVTETDSTFIHTVTVDYIATTPPATLDTRVIYEVMPGSATLGNDYYVASPEGALVFEPEGPTSELLYIDILPDTEDEVDEYFSIVINTITNGIIGTPDIHTITIQNYDEEESGDEGDGEVLGDDDELGPFIGPLGDPEGLPCGCPPEGPEVTPNPPVPCGVNGILNGDFEYPGVDLERTWDVFELNSSIINWFGHWMPGNPDSYGGADEPNPALLELQARVNGWEAQSGDQYAELDSDWGEPTVGLGGEPASLSIYQDLSTNINRYYEVSFYFSPRPNTVLEDNRLEFSWGGDIIETIEAVGTEDVSWTKYEYVLQADSDLTRIQFSDLGIPNSLGTFIDKIEAIEICDLDCEDLEGENGWYGEYFNYSIDHVDMGIPSSEWPDATHGDPLGAWTADWYDTEYYRFNQIDTNLEFGEDFFPFDFAPEEIHNGHDYHFGTHWSAKITVPVAGDYNYTLASDDDAWVYVDGDLIADNSGIHPLQTINDSTELTDEHIVDIFFAERHIVGSYLFFAFEDQRIIIEPYREDCEEEDVCISGPGWADVVEDYNQGETKGGGSVATDRSNPEVILDEADGVFFSLGVEGTITASFEGYVLDVDGDDLSFHEITYGRDTYPEETAFVEVSQDGIDWYELGTISNQAPADGVDYLDINSTGLTWIMYVRITDTTNYELHQDGADGYDLDAIDATYEACYYIGLEKYGEFNPLTGEITYTIDGLLEGDGTIYDPFVIDYLPEGTSFVWANGIGDYNEIDHTVTWDLNGVEASAHKYHTWTVIVALNEFLNMDVWADAFIVPFNQGLRKDGQPVLAERSNPNNALGEAQYDDTVNFVSMGFGGDIVLEFNNYIINGDGDDVEIIETSYGNPDEGAYPETAEIYASQDGNDWTYLDTIVLDGTVDLGTLEWAKYIKIVDVSDPDDFSSSTTTDGFDVDGVKAIYSLPDICEIENRVFGTVHTEPGGGLTLLASAFINTIINPYACPGNGDDNAYASGMKFNDLNGNGEKDGNEMGLEGWTIYAGELVETLEVDAHGAETGTPIDSLPLDSGQKYFLRVSDTFFAGDSITSDVKYSVREPNTEWTDIVQNYETWGPTLLELHIDGVTPDWGSYTSNHIYWHTLIGDGSPINLQIYDIYASNNVGSLTVEIYEVVAEDITDIDGNYWLDLGGLEGDVTVAEQTQSGWVQTAPSPDGFYIVPTNNASTGLDFGNQEVDVEDPELKLGSIAGMKFNDLNGNGELDQDELGLAGWVIYLDLNDNDEKDSEEPYQTTDNYGNYSFVNLGFGSYIVREENQSGWLQTFPGYDYDYAYNLTVNSCTNDWYNIDFGNQEGDGDEGDGNSGGGGGYYSPPAEEDDPDGDEEVLGDEDQDDDSDGDTDGDEENDGNEKGDNPSDNPGDTQGGSNFYPSGTTGGGDDASGGEVLGEDDDDPLDGGIVEGDTDGKGGALPFYLNFINYLWLLLLILLILLGRMIYRKLRSS